VGKFDHEVDRYINPMLKYCGILTVDVIQRANIPAGYVDSQIKEGIVNIESYLKFVEDNIIMYEVRRGV